MSPTSNGFPPTPHSWGLEKVGFPPAARVRTSDQATSRSTDTSGSAGGALAFSPPVKPRPIAIIDVGGAALDNPLLKPRIEYVSPHALRRATPAASETHGAHAAEVAGVIASACAADLIVYNIGTTAGWDRELFVAALENIVNRETKPAVVNISVGWRHQVETTKKSEAEKRAEAAVKACIKHGISVVVAMGEYAASSDLEWFPAVTDGVIAVGASDYNDLRFPDSDVGHHVWIAAPGEDILTVVNSDDFGSRSGTSFAAALVSAAVWLSLKADEELKPDLIREALGNSANSKRVLPGSPPEPRKGPDNRKWNDGVGCGRLDVRKFMMTVSPKAAAYISREVERVNEHAGAERQVATLVASEIPLKTAEGIVEPRKPDPEAGLSSTA